MRYYFPPDEDTNTKTIDIHEHGLIDTGLLNLNGTKLYPAAFICLARLVLINMNATATDFVNAYGCPLEVAERFVAQTETVRSFNHDNSEENKKYLSTLDEVLSYYA